LVSIDDDGATVVFSSEATDLDVNKADTNGKSDIYAHDLVSRPNLGCKFKSSTGDER
jgi:hypothetical protein